MVSVPPENAIEPYTEVDIQDVILKIDDIIKETSKDYRTRILKEDDLFKRYEGLDDFASLLGDALPEKYSELLKEIELRLTKTKKIYSLEKLDNDKTIKKQSHIYNKIRNHLTFIDLNSVKLFHEIKELFRSIKGKLRDVMLSQYLIERTVTTMGGYGAQSDMFVKDDTIQENLTDLRAVQSFLFKSLKNEAYTKDFRAFEDKKRRRKKAKDDTDK